jgi:hypothetical protein
MQDYIHSPESLILTFFFFLAFSARVIYLTFAALSFFSLFLFFLFLRAVWPVGILADHLSKRK